MLFKIPHAAWQPHDEIQRYLLSEITNMLLDFQKWHGSGNDFILIDDREGFIPRNNDWIRNVCSRHIGIGSDGLIFIERGEDFVMDFYNPDASQSFCGNGSRCAFAFYSEITSEKDTKTFEAIDGKHKASWAEGRVEVTMRDVDQFEKLDEQMDLIHTGSPHLLVWVEDPEALDIIPEAHQYRYNERFRKAGVNVNFLSWRDGFLEMRTYERGVEDETLSCGTGVTAAAISAMKRGFVSDHCDVKTRGGNLKVAVSSFGDSMISGITLQGPVKKVFTGKVEHP